MSRVTMTNIGASFIIKHFLVLSLFLSLGMGEDSPPTVVKHIVFNRFLSNLTQQDIERVITNYGNLRYLVPELKDWQWGVDLGPEIEDRAGGYTHAYISTLDSVDDLKKFLEANATREDMKDFFPASEKALVLNLVLNKTFPPKMSILSMNELHMPAAGSIHHK